MNTEVKPVIATPEEVKAASAADKIHAEVIKAPKGSFTILKRNMFVNSLGLHIKEAHDYLLPKDEDEVTHCKEWESLGLLKAN